jgi:hypothetical protein
MQAGLLSESRKMGIHGPTVQAAVASTPGRSVPRIAAVTLGVLTLAVRDDRERGIVILTIISAARLLVN